MEEVELDGSDSPTEFKKMLQEISTQTNQVKEKVSSYLEQFKDDPPPLDKGLSLLELKYHAFLEYMIGVTYGMLAKVSGKSLEKNSLIDLVVENRTVLERIRPIEQKLKYQIDKLLKAARGELSVDDPLRFKANPDLLVAKDGGESSSEEGEGSEDEDGGASKKEDGKSKGVYVPPKLMAMPYDGDISLAEKKAQREARIKRQALTSNLLQELREEYTDAPVELVETDDIVKAKQHRKAKEKQDYEETYMTRIQLTKADKKGVKRRNLGTELTSFGNFAQLMDEDNEDLQLPAKKKSKTAFKNGKGGKGKKGGGKKGKRRK